MLNHDGFVYFLSFFFCYNVTKLVDVTSEGFRYTNVIKIVWSVQLHKIEKFCPSGRDVVYCQRKKIEEGNTQIKDDIK